MVKALREEEIGRITEPDDFTAPNPWLRRTGWARHLQGFSEKKAELRQLISMEYKIDGEQSNEEADDDRELQLIHEAFDGLVQRARATARPEEIS